MAYREAMVAAGAEVLEFASFGSYQGDWYAKVVYAGTTGWVHGYYGSWPGCDAFQAEFGYGGPECDEHRYLDPVEDCEHCHAAKRSYDARMKDFGIRYLHDLYTYDEVLKSASEHLDWDLSAEEVVNWIKERK